MGRLKKGLALVLAVAMCITVVPLAAAKKSEKAGDEISFNTGSYEYHMIQESDMEALFKSFSDKYGASAMEPESYEGNKEAEAEAARLSHYAVYEPNGDYEITVEENAFFPYEVQFSYDGKTFQKWFMENGDSVTVGGHTFRVKSNTNGKVITKMSIGVGGDTIRVYPEEKAFTNDESSLSQGVSLLPLKEKKLSVDLKYYTPVELTKITFAEVFQGEDELPKGTSIMWKVRPENNDSLQDYKVGSLYDEFDLFNRSLEIIVGEPDQLASDNIRYLLEGISAPGSNTNWLTADVFSADENKDKIDGVSCWYRTMHQADGTENKVASIRFEGSKRDGQYDIRLKLNQRSFPSDKINFTEMRVYEGKCTESTLGKDITSSIWGDGKDTPGSGYLMTLKDCSAKQWITFVSYKNGRITGCLPVQLDVDGSFYTGVEV